MVQIKFGTDGWRAIIAKEYTTDNVARVSQATADWLQERYEQPKVVIGYDCRFGGKMFSEVAARVFCAAQVKVVLSNSFVSTPMVSLAAKELEAQQGVVITASHNPPDYNGYKLKADFGGPSSPKVIAEVEALIPESAVIPDTSIEDYKKQGLIEYVDLEAMYLKRVEESFDLELIRNSGIGVAYDAMYGAGQQVIRKILPHATLLHCDFNPSFMGQAPEPLHRNLQELSDLMASTPSLGFGLANDGDADRIGMYDATGRFVDSHHIILLLVHYLSQYKKMTGKVVNAFSVSGKVKKLCAHYGLDYQVTKIGFKYICEIMVEEDVLLGGEESGGIAVKGHIPERDGIWMGLLILEFMAKTGKSLEELIQEVYEVVGPFHFDRNDLHITNELKHQIMENCANGVYTSFGLYKVQELENVDGYKYHLSDNEWVMIRPSGTEPVLRVYAEAPTTGGVADVLESTKAVLLR